MTSSSSGRECRASGTGTAAAEAGGPAGINPDYCSWCSRCSTGMTQGMAYRAILLAMGYKGFE